MTGSAASVKTARNRNGVRSSGQRSRGWQWWSTARMPSHSARRSGPARRPGSIRIRGPSELGEVLAKLERLVVRREGLDVGSLHRDVRSSQPVADDLHDHVASFEVADGLLYTRPR